MSFKERAKYTREEAERIYYVPSNMIKHMLLNDDGTCSIMAHIVCEYCDYCQAEVESATYIHVAQEDPYLNQKTKEV